jgi:hypothetical protein
MAKEQTSAVLDARDDARNRTATQQRKDALVRAIPVPGQHARRARMATPVPPSHPAFSALSLTI